MNSETINIENEMWWSVEGRHIEDEIELIQMNDGLCESCKQKLLKPLWEQYNKGKERFSKEESSDVNH